MKITLQDNNSVLFLTGNILITSIAMVLLLVSVCFFAGGNVAAWQFPTAFVLTAGMYFLICKKQLIDNRSLIKAILISIAVIIISIIAALSLYDVTYDGQSYHQEGIYQLKNGWNSFRVLLPKSVNMAIYINHYGKGVEIPQSTLYALTHQIESAKATNFILFSAVFCLTLSLLLGLNKITPFKCILSALLATCNPIIINQLISTYVDGQLALMIQSFFITAIWLIAGSGYTSLLLLASVIVIGANVKFTGVVYIVIFSISFLAWLLFNKKIELFKNVLYTSLFSGVVAILLAGYNPYVVNMVKFSHPFYPLMGKQKVDIVGYNLPNGFEQKNGMNKLFTSLFAHTDNQISNKQKTVDLKLPFAINKTDILNASKVDTRIAGFGPFFSGILLLSAVLLCLLLAQPGKFILIKNMLYLAAAIVVAVLIMPESWWARYIPQTWYLPIIVILAAELYAANKFQVLKLFLYLFLIVNVSLCLIGFGWNMMMTALVNHQITKLKASHQIITVQFGDLKANRFRLEENHIPYQERNLDGLPDVENFIRSDSKFIIPANVASFPESKFLKWAEQFK
ncbi:MAG: hypothetical protein EOP42_11760 [Sphingobacteriaceae bacterium]|nr:MAG: hypothetical protein EOP42_11760 [Sphingobacteriaceae bacterium]